MAASWLAGGRREASNNDSFSVSSRIPHEYYTNVQRGYEASRQFEMPRAAGVVDARTPGRPDICFHPPDAPGPAAASSSASMRRTAAAPNTAAPPARSCSRMTVA